jgi:hypothetical protein
LRSGSRSVRNTIREPGVKIREGMADETGWRRDGMGR